MNNIVNIDNHIDNEEDEDDFLINYYYYIDNVFHSFNKRTLETLINSSLLEKSPDEYLHYLSIIKESNFHITRKINDNSEYRTWYSPPIQQLFYLTGDLYNEKKNHFYGSNTSINQDTAISILKLMICLGANPNVRNYYDETIYTMIKNDTVNSGRLTYRVNNDRFIEYIQKNIGC